MNKHISPLAVLVLFCIQSLNIQPGMASDYPNLNNPISLNEPVTSNSSNRVGLPQKQTELVAYPLSFIISGLELGVETNSFLKKSSQTLRFSAGYFYSHRASLYDEWRWNEEYKFSEMEVFRSEIQYRIYTRNFAAPDNIFFAASAVFKSLAMDQSIYARDVWPRTIIENRTVKSNSFSLGILLGYRTRVYDMISADFFFGGGFTPTNNGDYEVAHIDHMNPFRKSINLRGGITIGIRL